MKPQAPNWSTTAPVQLQFLIAGLKRIKEVIELFQPSNTYLAAQYMSLDDLKFVAIAPVPREFLQEIFRRMGNKCYFHDVCGQ
ncbi:MAG TPA: hypothetical protein VHZ07_26150 [Bryobacteraceae bacterium]|nr:hypothetical protein [Bryobacteraceae bacterium]